MVQYYTQEEAAKILGMDIAELKRMAERGELRAFRDRGTMRFRNQEVDELARRRGMGTNPSLNLGAPSHLAPQPTSPAPAPATPPPAAARPATPPPAAAGNEDVFNFHVTPPGEEEVDFGEGMLEGGSASAARQSRSGSRKPAASPKPLPGSDSEVRLVADGSQLDIHLAPSSGTPPASGSAEGKVKSSLQGPSQVDRPESKLDTTGASPRPSRIRRPESHLDSGVRLVPPPGEPGESGLRLSGESGVHRVGSSSKLGKPRGDSVFRLEEPAPPPESKRSKVQPVTDGSSTEEIDLDAELREAGKGGSSRSRSSKVKPQSGIQQPQSPVTSPFELSSLDEPQLRPVSKVSGLGSSPPASGAGRSPSKLKGSSKIAPPADDEVNLGELHGGVMDSGINLQNPGDSGISLEQQGATEEDDFELSLDAGMTPAPGPKSGSSKHKRDSDFELSLDAGMTPAPGPKSGISQPKSDSDFELSLDAGMTPSAGRGSPDPASGSAGPPSDSDFELSLDAGMTPQPSEAASLDDESDDFELSLDAGGATPRPSSSASVSDEGDSEFELTLDDSDSMDMLEGTTEPEQERDIFETDFDVPVLDEESDDIGLQEDTDLASSDFDLSVDDQELESDDMSLSQVVALDDEEEADATSDDDSSSQVMAIGDDEEDFDVDTSLGEDEEGDLVPAGDFDEDEEEEDGAVAAAPAAAPWGAVPALFLIPCVLVMFVVGIIGYEMIGSMSGYRSNKKFSTPVVKMLADVLTGNDKQ